MRCLSQVSRAPPGAWRMAHGVLIQSLLVVALIEGATGFEGRVSVCV